MNFDIAIVGGGAIGASLALALKPFSLKIALIESVASDLRSDEDFDARSLSLSPSSQRIFSSMGLWHLLKSNVIPIEHIHVSDKGHFFVNRFHARDEGVNALGYMIEAHDLNRLLANASRDVTHITHFCPAHLEGLTIDEQGAELTINDAGHLKKISAQLVIAADGSYSKVRQLQKIDYTEWDYAQSALVANIGLARDHNNTAYERFTAQGPMALLPLSRKRCALIWSLPKTDIEAYLQLSDKDFLLALQANFGYRLGRFVKVGKRSSFPLKMVYSTENTASSLIFIGNAAQTIHPVAGQGFNLGLRDVAALVTVISEAISAGNSLTSPSVLQHYEDWRIWDRRQMLIFSDGLTRLYSNRYSIHSLIRSFCMGSVSFIPPAKQLLLKHTMGVAGRLPDLACGLTLASNYDKTL